ncbi:GNAT family N-acetyltransferase [Marinicella sp. S1101]|uniref:GNAT family N-acetyltransferase n=1 Tax=Marinicella marina TaxID=2996016 RepID=UPI002260D409|nr:GNAT family N-acetyltransferase [Marinicella marina]MCX7553600.1 GNAT family N-acetyltransferase [Marinicella marina]MDJ1140224.1 GNAT family N-acetyltransferase [Marinicella marina]
MEIKRDDVTGLKVIQLLQEHQDRMADHSPPESRHVLDVKALQQDNISFWSLWHADELLGCVALKHWSDQLGEIKSMKTAPSHTKKGVGKKLLQHVIAEAKNRGYKHLKLETGSMAYFKPARSLYLKFGFSYCQPFGDYVQDPNNVFMALDLHPAKSS